MRVRYPSLAVAAALAALGTLPAAPALARAHRPRVAPRGFASCTRLIGYERSHFAVTHGVPETPVVPEAEPATGLPLTPSAPGTQGAAAPAPTASAPASGTGSTSFSTTNNQEPGVDEPDIVKTDGRTIFAVQNGTLYAVAVAAGSPRLEGTVALGSAAAGAQLLLRGNRLLVVSSASRVPVPLGVGVATPAAAGPSIAPLPPVPVQPSIPYSPYWYGGTTAITEVDVHDPAAMKVTRTLSFDGTFVDARQNGATARLVISSAPSAIAQPALQTRTAGWVPARRFHSFLTGRRYTRRVAACASIRRPVQFSGVGMLSIITIDLDKGLYTAGSQAVLADAQVVYGSTTSLYVATQKWIPPQTPVDQVPAAAATVIDKFDATNPDATTFAAAGEVPGYLLNQFSLSEYQGDLRVASTSRPIWWGSAPPSQSQSYVTVLAQQGSSLVPVGQVAGLGAGQQIYSVRFLGDTGYVVTFHQVDPLYVVDLRTPSAPRVAGTLELAGYSSYLHPVGNGLLLGIGQDVSSANEPSGTQLELFDVANPSAPRLIARTLVGSGSSSQVQYDHHAFLFWPPTGLAVLPVSISPIVEFTPSPGAPAASGPATPSSSFVGAIGYHIDASGITEVGRVAHDPLSGYSPAIERSLVIGNQLFTLSSEGVMASNLASLAREAFVTFPG
jgi:uncharacterized secreted protein with C-terminal beta-propeller domain